MTTTAQGVHRRSEEVSATDRLAARISQQVLQTLGTPPGGHLVQVRPLWGDYYRVNVLLGQSPTCFRIGHSFFLQTDGGGDVIESSPPIVKRY